ncbi:hypothetical protein [Streptomyces sp. ADMS]|uniref:hypothetical protein n=1 Tax=Streptomyces sp. ADMS TaxID=3071415 RepID=UPI00296E707C|nr:hypothetical protein [Streptomyces sp. ADMS]
MKNTIRPPRPGGTRRTTRAPRISILAHAQGISRRRPCRAAWPASADRSRPTNDPSRANEDTRLLGMISEADLARNLPDKEVSRFVEAEVSRSV